MGPRCMKYQEIKKSDSYWSQKLIKKTIFQVSGGPHIVTICGWKYVVDLDQMEIYRYLSFCSLSMGPKCMKYQEIKKSDSYWSQKLIKKTIFQVSGGPHIVTICGSKYVVDLDPTLKCQKISIYCPSGPS